MSHRINSLDTILANTKTNGRKERGRITVKLGEQYKLYEYGEYLGTITITAENRQRIEDEMNDRENDVTSYVPEHSEQKRKPYICVITYDAGKPGVKEETYVGPYDDAFRYAAHRANGWGFEIQASEILAE